MKRTGMSCFFGCLILTLLCRLPARSENPSASPHPAGSCDSPYPDAQGNVTFSCRGLNDEQMRLLPSVSTLVDKLLHSDVDNVRLDAQTDNILKMLQTPAAPPKSEARKAATAPSAKPPKGPQSPEEVITYDYRGFKTSSLTGPMLVDGDEGESGQYQKLLALQKGGEWKKLLKESTREIKKVPDWLTPYAFKAVALQHLGNNQEAIKALEYVDQRSVGNPDYDQVRSLLQHLKTAK